jgi:hypothetical protein
MNMFRVDMKIPEAHYRFSSCIQYSLSSHWLWAVLRSFPILVEEVSSKIVEWNNRKHLCFGSSDKNRKFWENLSGFPP